MRMKKYFNIILIVSSMRCDSNLSQFDQAVIMKNNIDLDENNYYKDSEDELFKEYEDFAHSVEEDFEDEAKIKNQSNNNYELKLNNNDPLNYINNFQEDNFIQQIPVIESINNDEEKIDYLINRINILTQNVLNLENEIKINQQNEIDSTAHLHNVINQLRAIELINNDKIKHVEESLDSIAETINNISFDQDEIKEYLELALPLKKNEDGPIKKESLDDLFENEKQESLYMLNKYNHLVNMKKYAWIEAVEKEQSQNNNLSNDEIYCTKRRSRENSYKNKKINTRILRKSNKK